MLMSHMGGSDCEWNGLRSPDYASNRFGTFESRARAARDGRNPSTGEPIKISATTVNTRPA